MSKKVTMGAGSSEREGKRVGAGKFAGMPTEVQMKQYPKANQYGPSVLDDTITEIDGCNREAHTKARKYVSNQH